MSISFPTAPAIGTPMSATNASDAARRLIALRRSVSKRGLTTPGPNEDELDTLLTVATRVPDHRRLSPWRFIVFEGDRRREIGPALVDIQKQENPEATETMLADTAGYFLRAPVVVGVVSSPDYEHKTPVWEQELSAGALCLNLLLAANASGWAGCWLTEWISFSPGVNRLFNLSDTERFAGFLYLGTASGDPQERLRPDAQPLIQRWSSQNS
ncbi:MAG: nitroreductase family protein [Henriciella sp.]|nr:nitroreductase family protein [Henriciella sp.]